MAGKKSPIWYGYLEAGDKRSPVARDGSLDTGNPATVYIFNLNKGKILEYRRDIVEGKLRELNSEEKNLRKTLKKMFEEARTTFTPRGRRRPDPKPRPRPVEEEVEIPDFEDTDGDDGSGLPFPDDAEGSEDDD